MQAKRLLAGGLVALCGCISLSRESPVAVRERDLTQFGAGVVRPGMTKAEVDAILDLPVEWFPYCTTGIFTDRQVCRYSDLAVCFKGVFGEGGPPKVVYCYAAEKATEGGEAATFTDEQLKGLLRSGMSASEVGCQIGSPLAGYEDEPGKVITVHPQPGIMVEYEGGRLKSWRRYHVYRPVSQVLGEQSLPATASPSP